ncbi:MAG: hypothetical protein AAGG51_21015 [Cyanobacteria bacterium P01_G01_bin.54]
MAHTPPTGALLTGEIAFVQYFLPPLQSGKYTISVAHRATGQGDRAFDETYNSRRTVYVRGNRFGIQPEEIKYFFPPNNSRGIFTNVLPHLVFAKKGLPWEWTVGGGAQNPKPDGNVATWLGLLVFHETDPPPVPQPMTLADLMPNKLPSGTIAYPNLTLLPGESTDDKITAIDVPIKLFNAIAPNVNDLTYLAHSRIVSPAKKATSPENKATDYSVIVANRLPQTGANTVHLVSLEGMASYLPEGKIPSGTQFIRLVSLRSWQFSVIPEKYSFEGLLENLNLSPSTLQRPYKTENPSAADKTVENALKMGYVALNEQTRQGDRTVSWYRGPFVPYAIPETVKTPISCADALVRYNPDTGMFDESYAAAWQLGQLLALQNQGFAVTLYNWKRSNQIQTVALAEQEILDRALSQTLPSNAGTAPEKVGAAMAM